MKPRSRAALFLACIVLSVASLINVFGDNDDVQARAKMMACPAVAQCGLTHMARTPFAQTFDYTTRSGTTTIRCARTAIFFGEYDCQKH